MKLSPLAFIPKQVPKVWGSELWQLYDRPGDSAVVARGPMAGQSLQALMAEFGPNLLGPKAFEAGAAYFPLAFKLIDAREALSVQVHPDDDQAARLAGPDELGKSEAWLVLKAEAGASLTAGLKPGTTREMFMKALKAGSLEGLLNRFPVKAGDAVYVPAGRVHAIGKGCLVAELQQNSDTTLRVHDYGRLENGKPRALQIDQALECIRFNDTDEALLQPRVLSGGETLLLESPHFKASRLDLKQGFRPSLGEACFHLLSCLEGSARIESEGPDFEFKPGETVLLPAGLPWRLAAAKEGTQVLWSRP